MWPILLCSVLALAIVGERLWSLRRKSIVPGNLVHDVWRWEKAGQMNATRMEDMATSSLGRILVAGLACRSAAREIMQQNMESVGKVVAHELEHSLNTLGTIASITPLLGLLGTVIGMIKVFAAITLHGVGDPTVLAEGISEALVTTAFGLAVAIPSLMFHRYFRSRIDGFVVTMEQESLKLVEVISALRARDKGRQ